MIFYAAYPHDWKQQAGITFVPGIDPQDMPTPTWPRATGEHRHDTAHNLDKR